MKYLPSALLLLIGLIIFNCTKNFESTPSNHESKEVSKPTTPQRPSTKSTSMKTDEMNTATQPTDTIKRKVVNEVSPQVMDKTGKVVFNICINREGDVVHTKYNLPKSTLTDRSVVIDALSAMKKTTFQRDNSAPRKECGQWVFKYPMHKANNNVLKISDDKQDMKKWKANTLDKMGRDTAANKGEGDPAGGADFDKIGTIQRAVVKRVFPKDLSKSGKVVFNICIHRDGKVVYAKYNRSKSTLTDRSPISDALIAMKKTTFQAANLDMPPRECGQWTIDFTKK